MDDFLDLSNKIDVLHKLRGCLNPIRTFVHFADPKALEPKMRDLKKACEEKFVQVEQLLNRLAELWERK